MELTIAKTPGRICLTLSINETDLDRALPFNVAVNREDNTLLFDSKPGHYYEGYGDPFVVTPSLRDILGWLMEPSAAWYLPSP